MKRYWRCFVCNDIHYGVRPPEICPTCGGQLRTPTFINTETNDLMCGEVDYEKLKEWATK